MAGDSIWLNIEAAVEFLDVLFPRQTIFDPLSPIPCFLEGRDILPGETACREIVI